MSMNELETENLFSSRFGSLYVNNNVHYTPAFSDHSDDSVCTNIQFSPADIRSIVHNLKD